MTLSGAATMELDGPYIGGSGGTSFRDLFSQYFRGGGGEVAGPIREPGSDLEYRVEIGFWDAVRGAVKKITISRLDSCPKCHGTGRIKTAPK